MVRSIFFFNALPEVGSSVALHFFEPRYRLLVVRALSSKRERQFVYLPNFVDYQASHGDIGYLATIVEHRAVPVGNELPRADVRLRFDARVIILFHWIESNTGGLVECVAVPLDDALPSLEDSWSRVRQPELVARLNHPGMLIGSEMIVDSAQHQHPELPHYLLRTTSEARAETMLAAIEADVPGSRGLVHPLIVPAYEETISLAQLVRRLAELWLRLSVHSASAAATASTGIAASSHASTAAVTAAAAAAAQQQQQEEQQQQQPPDIGDGDGDNGATSSSSPPPPKSPSKPPPLMSEDERAEAAFKSLPLRELRARLSDMHISLSASCLEKEDLVSLLTSASRKERLGTAAADAADAVGAELLGMRVPLACGCPAGGLVVRSCSFARHADGRRLSIARPGSLWGSSHDFGVNQKHDTNVGQVCVAVYDWERRHLAHHRGDLEPALAPAADEVFVPMMTDYWDAAAALGPACVLTLGSHADEYAAPVLPPNLIRVYRADAHAAVSRLTRRLNWPRVRLLFIGHQEGGEAAGGADAEGGADAYADNGAAGGGQQAGEDGEGVLTGCRFALLDRELLWLVAEWLVNLDCADEGGGAVRALGAVAAA